MPFLEKTKGGWMDRWMDSGWDEQWMDSGWMDDSGWDEQWMDSGWMDGQWMDGCMDGMDRWIVDGQWMDSGWGMFFSHHVHALYRSLLQISR